MRTRESHVSHCLNSRSCVVRFCTTPTHLIPFDLLTQSRQRCPPLQPSSKTRQRPSMIKTRASGSPSKHLETCETADHNPRAQNLSVCIISLTPSPNSPFPRPLTTSTRVPFLTARPRGIIFNFFDITSRPGRRCQFSRFRRARIDDTSRQHRITSLRTHESELKSGQSTFFSNFFHPPIPPHAFSYHFFCV